jgi:hypothetical protein
MKRKYVFLKVVILSLFVSGISAQSEVHSFIPSLHLAITCNKTTNVIFPFSIQSVDRGSQDILVQQPKGTENILQVKADKPNFEQTNLSIITIDGNLYSFIVDYTATPVQLNVVIGSNQLPSDSITGQIVKLSSGINEAVF